MRGRFSTREVSGSLAAVVAVVLAGAGVFGAESNGPAPGEGRPRAWIRFEKGPESYAGRPYYFLGRGDLHLVIDAPPQAGDALELHWGAKGGRRGAVATINGKAVNISHGGYDGFAWLRVAMPEGLDGKQYEITLKAGAGKAAFLAEVRLVGAAAPEADGPEPSKTTAHKIALKSAPKGGPRPAVGGSGTDLRQPPAAPPFPEMQAIWDRPLPPPAKPLADAKLEAAFRQAEKHGRQANEMFFRCRKFVDGWLAHADPNTGLIPRNLGRDRGIWNAKDSAADNYPFMVLTCALTDRAMFDGRMLDMLRTETKLTSRIDRMPDTYSFAKQGFASDEANLGSIMFGSSEYIKDGLIPLTEWLGPSPWCDRMIGMLDDMWKHAPVDTPYGKIVSTNFEINGEMLQVLSRVYWMTGEKKYLQWAVRLGDYYLLGDHHPTRNATKLSMDDHGCEAISGLCELYATVHFALPEKKKAYEKPLHEMLDTILAKARTPHGVFYDWFNPQTGQHAASLTDNWGYDLNGFYTVYLVDKTPEYRQAIVTALGNLYAHYIDYKWERGVADGYADSIEGAINLYNRERIAAAMPWIDSEIKDMWHKQKSDGVVEGWHGDGNSARTAIMYALMKTQGLSVRPWRKDLRFGAVEEDGALCVSLYAEKPWTGRLLFDRARHKVQMRLPLDYPRINQFPEWYTVQAGGRYTVGGAAGGKQETLTGKRLQQGLEVKLAAGVETRLVVKAVVE